MSVLPLLSSLHMGPTLYFYATWTATCTWAKIAQETSSEIFQPYKKLRVKNVWFLIDRVILVATTVYNSLGVIRTFYFFYWGPPHINFSISLFSSGFPLHPSRHVLPQLSWWRPRSLSCMITTRSTLLHRPSRLAQKGRAGAYRRHSTICPVTFVAAAGTSDQAMITMVDEEKRDGEGVIQNNKKKE